MHITRNEAIKEPFEQVPLIFGVIGHRDIRPGDEPKLREAIREVILEYRAKDKYPETPIVVLTALAEGADRLGAEVALELGEECEDERFGGVHFVAVLPMPPEEYARDFKKSKAEFERYCEAAKAIWVMDWVDGCPSTGERPKQECRRRQYTAAGEFIAVNSHVLIALWDGKPTEFEAGTAWITKRREKIQAAVKPLQHKDPCGYGPLIQIVTPRVGYKESEKLNGELFERIEAPSHDSESASPLHSSEDQEGPELQHHQKIYLAIEDFNRHVARLSGQPFRGLSATEDDDNEDAMWRKAPEDNAEEIKGNEEGLCSARGADAAELPGSLRWTRRLFATADTLANRYQGGSHHHLRHMILGAALAGISLDLFHALHGILHESFDAPMAWAVCFCFVAFVSASWVVMGHLIRTQDGRHHERYLAYRSLAETLRVQFFWKLTGVRETVALHFAGRDEDELDWIRSAADVAWRMMGAKLDPANDLRAWPSTKARKDATGLLAWSQWDQRLQRTIHQWIHGQRNYFKGAAVRDEKWLHRHEEAVGLSIRSALFMAFLCAGAALYSFRGVPLNSLLAALMAAAVALCLGVLLMNAFCCSTLGAKQPPKPTDGIQAISFSWYDVRQAFESALGCFSGLVQVPRWIRRESEKHRSMRRREAWRASVLVLALLGSGTLLASILTARLPAAGHNSHDGDEHHSEARHPVSQEQEPDHHSPAAKFAKWVEFSSISMIGLSLLSAGLFHFRGYRHAFEVHAKSYASMYQVFSEALTRLGANEDSAVPIPSTPPSHDEACEVLKQLGDAALGENSNWAATHHSRPLEPPLG